jgi:hypothetical protein
MKKNTGQKNLYVILSMLALLALSFGLDRLILSMKEYVSQEFKGVLLMLLLFPISSLVLAAGVLLLFWFTVSRMKKSAVVSTVFIILGILVDLLVLSFITPLGIPLLFLQPFLLPTSNLFLMAIFVMVIGILSLVLPHPKE